VTGDSWQELAVNHLAELVHVASLGKIGERTQSGAGMLRERWLEEAKLRNYLNLRGSHSPLLSLDHHIPQSLEHGLGDQKLEQAGGLGLLEPIRIDSEMAHLGGITMGRE